MCRASLRLSSRGNGIRLSESVRYVPPRTYRMAKCANIGDRWRGVGNCSRKHALRLCAIASAELYRILVFVNKYKPSYFRCRTIRAATDTVLSMIVIRKPVCPRRAMLNVTHVRQVIESSRQLKICNVSYEACYEYSFQCTWFSTASVT
jgi:hypothetical protein